MLTQLISNNIRPNSNLGLTEELPTIKTSGINSLLNSHQSGFGQIQQNSILNSTNDISEIFNDLKKISFFDLLEQTPTIKQLFSTDYKELVSNLINVQETNLNFRNEDLSPFENVINNLGRNSSHLELAQFRDLDLGNVVSDKSNLILADPLGGSNKNIENFNSNPDYNHLLHQEGSRNPNMQSTTSKPPLRNRNQNSSETKPQPYEDKKNKKEGGNLGQNLIKSAARALNILSLKLNELAK